MQKITIETVKGHCKGYTEAFGYYSCRKTDFDWLMNEAIKSKQLRIAYENTQQLRQKSAKMILAIVYLNERIDQLQVGKERMALNLLREKNKVTALNKLLRSLKPHSTMPT